MRLMRNSIIKIRFYSEPIGFLAGKKDPDTQAEYPDLEGHGSPRGTVSDPAPQTSYRRGRHGLQCFWIKKTVSGPSPLFSFIEK
jgi:hypothetical protein